MDEIKITIIRQPKGESLEKQLASVNESERNYADYLYDVLQETSIDEFLTIE